MPAGYRDGAAEQEHPKGSLTAFPCSFAYGGRVFLVKVEAVVTIPRTPAPTPDNGRQWGDIPYAADRFGVSVKTIRRWIAAGRITGYRAGPRLIRVNMAELEAAMQPIPTVRRDP
jgi:excisionase family DNA binding protein